MSRSLGDGGYPVVIAPVTDRIPPKSRIGFTLPTLNSAETRWRCTRSKELPSGLHDFDDVLGLAEGIETALAAHEIFGIPVWAAISANGVLSFEPPHSVKRLEIFGDNDSNFVGASCGVLPW